MEITRGIIELDNNNTLKVSAVGAIYNLPKFKLPIENYKINAKVHGVVIDDTFNVIFNFKMSGDNSLYGFYTSNEINNTFKIKVVQNYQPTSFDAFNSNYELGDELTFEMNQIKEINLN